MFSLALAHRFESELVRYAGGQARLVFYKGEKPATCEERAQGERVADQAASEDMLRGLYRGDAPPLPEGANYWRLLNNDGNVAMQG